MHKQHFIVCCILIYFFTEDIKVNSISFFMPLPSTSKKLMGHIGFGLCVHPSICSKHAYHAC